MTWQDRAECRKYPRDHMMIESEDYKNRNRFGIARRRIDERLAICAACSVRDECLEWATRTVATTGISWAECIIGGKIANEVNAIARPFIRPPCGTNAGYESHRTHKDRICEACRLAHTRYNNPGNPEVAA